MRLLAFGLAVLAAPLVWPAVGGVLTAAVRDDGIGGADLGAGAGLSGIARRVEVFDGG